jgi:hypothetical protein
MTANFKHSQIIIVEYVKIIIIESSILQNKTTCSLLEIDWRFGRQVRKIIQAGNQHEAVICQKNPHDLSEMQD